MRRIQSELRKRGISFERVVLSRRSRFFRPAENAFLIVARDLEENNELEVGCRARDYLLEVLDIVGPRALLWGADAGRCLELAANVAATFVKYAPRGTLRIEFRRRDGKHSGILEAMPLPEEELKKLSLKED